MSRSDLDQLLNVLLPFAQRVLAREGEFHPFGGSLTQTREVVLVAASEGADRQPSQEVLAWLEDSLRETAAAGGVRAVGICVDALVVPPGATLPIDAIETWLEDLEGEAVTTYLPYRRAALGNYRFGELFACEGVPHLFPNSGPD
jgi:hypothetical protein